MKQYVGIVRDHSGSMRMKAEAARKDYNSLIENIKKESVENNIDTIVSVINCGVGIYGKFVRDVVISNVNTLKPIPERGYKTDGNYTPLLDSVGDLIEQFNNLPDSSSPEVSFLIMVVTDGQENNSRTWSARDLSNEIKRLQGSDRWTFVFRVPRGDAMYITHLGIPAGNILEWEDSSEGMERSTVATASAVQNYYTARATGATKSATFYADLNNVSRSEVKKDLVDITRSVKCHPVNYEGMIRPYVESLGYTYIKGTVFYEITKKETVQQHKDIIVFDKISRKYYIGDNARDMLGIPKYGDIKLYPAYNANYKIYIQSTSVNRKLVPGTDILILTH